jgi:hypothetical protein
MSKTKLRALLYKAELKLNKALKNGASDAKLRTLENNMRYLQAISK